MVCIAKKGLIETIPHLFLANVTEEDFSQFFEIVKTIFSFENYYYFSLNSEDIQLRATNNKSFELNSNFDISEGLIQRLFEKKSEILTPKDELIKVLSLSGKSFLVSKLNIKDAIFGFLLLETNTLYCKEDLSVINAISAVLSYKIKDLELSNVFKIQTKALKSAIEDTHNAYQTIKSQNKKILAAEKVKNEFLASVSHELRTPLNAIIGYSDVLKSLAYGELNQKQEEYISEIQIAGVQLLGMVNEILDITKIEANAIKLVKRYFEISRPIIETKNLLLPLIKNKDLEIIVNIENDIDIYADYQKIQQILYNLLSNAIKYSPNGGKIYITTTNTAKRIKISVKDDGIGIDKKHHKQIFKKFVQLEEAFYKKETSTGLGLAITKQLVELHRGSIKVESELNKGANFIVTLPIEAPDEFQV